MPVAFVSIGSNIEPERHLRMAWLAVTACFRSVQVSPVYRSPAVGMQGSDFLNAVLRFDSDLQPVALARWLRALEDRAGRDRSQPKFSPRTLDLDLLLHGRQIIESASLSLPRPDLLDYAFILRPLADLVPEERHPLLDLSYRELLQQQRENKPDQEAAMTPVSFEWDH